MILKVLGCSGSQTPDTHPCSFMIDDSVVMDMGSAASVLTLQQQCGIRDVLLSHAHLDHIKDLPSIVENVSQTSKETIRIWGTASTLSKLSSHIFNGVIWPDFTSLPTPANSVLEYHTFNAGISWTLGGMKVLPIAVNHPGGCVGFLLQSDSGVLIYSGDTGPTEELWSEARRVAEKLRGILIETSFPNRLQDLAEQSGHLTPRTLQAELGKLPHEDVPIFVYHIKEPTRAETQKEIRQLEDPRIQLLQPGMEICF